MKRALLALGWLGVLAACTGLVDGVARGLAQARGPRPFRVECLGSSSSGRVVVYLHGRDTRGPSWIEMRNREAWRVISQELDVVVAMPRAPRGSWPQGDAEDLATSVAWIEEAEHACLAEPDVTVVVGFSDGGNLLNSMLVRGVAIPAGAVVSIGSEGAKPPDEMPAGVPVRLVGGMEEPTFLATRLFARQLASAGVDATFTAHPGIHSVPCRETLQVLDELLDRGLR